MLAVIKEYNLDFEALLKGLLFWTTIRSVHRTSGHVSSTRNITIGTETELHANEEETT